MNVFLQAHRDNERKIREIKLAKSREHIQQVMSGSEDCKNGVEHSDRRCWWYDSDYAKQYAEEQIETHRSEASEQY